MSDPEAQEARIDAQVARIGAQLAARGWTLGTAESCTGGLVGHLITNLSGSSAFYLGGVVAYANEIKREVLGVPEELLLTYGAVSAEVAVAMAAGVRCALGATVGVSTTGIAGPTGGTPQKPVGLVFVGISGPLGERAWRLQWAGDRLSNKARSAEEALELVEDYLSEGV
jgi:PncC family amidohydrolase